MKTVTLLITLFLCIPCMAQPGKKVKEKRKAEIEAKKEAIRQEDIAKGVFVPVSMLPAAEPKKGVANA